MILIVNYGSQYTLLIQKALNSFFVESIIHNPLKNPNLCDVVDKIKPKGIILSGGPQNIKIKEHLEELKLLSSSKVPILGICFGFQLIVHYIGGEIIKNYRSEFGNTTISLNEYNCELFNEISDNNFQVWMSHSNGIRINDKVKNKIIITSYSNNLISSFRIKNSLIFALQFHPEVEHTHHGQKILENFVINICGETRIKTNTVKLLFDRTKDEVLRRLKNNKVALALSGGTDSTILAVFLNKILNEGQLICLFVDNGLLRKYEANDVKIIFDRLNLPVKYLKCQNIFLKNLKNINDPERKRKIIGETFINIFEKTLKKEKISFLAQGTIHSDVVESSINDGIKLQKTIKSHHNVGGLPKKLKLKLLEPFANLYKHEVRNIGVYLGLKTEFLKKHPFPGPGLAVRIIGPITKKKIQILRKADFILCNYLQTEGIYYKIGQGFTVLLESKSTGVKGDNRFYGYVLAIRLVITKNFMTADIYEIDYPILKKIVNKILNKVPEISRIIYDVTSKPPATIEWE